MGGASENRKLNSSRKIAHPTFRAPLNILDIYEFRSYL